MKLGVFIERDGILNGVRAERQAPVVPLTLEDLQVHREAAPLLQKLKAAGFVLIATTNQPGISKGCQSRRELDRMHGVIRTSFPLDDLLVCPHDESDRCPCRKPKPGLLVEAAFQWHLDLERSFVLSDKWQDAEAARVVGCTSLLVASPWIGKVHRDFLVPDLATAVDKLLQVHTSSLALA